MKPYEKIYEIIPALPPPNQHFVHVPGAYCTTCGNAFALYSTTLIPPDGVDENGKPYYLKCKKCSDEIEDKTAMIMFGKQ